MSLQDKRSIWFVLGNLIKNPTLLDKVKYPLETYDFPETFHKIIFGAIKNLYVTQGLETLDIVTIDSFLSNYDKQYKIFTENNGLEYIQTAVENSNLESFDYHYQRVKKFSILRIYKKNGIDVSHIYDENIINPAEQEQMQQKFDKMSIEDIFNAIESKFDDIKTALLKNSDQYGQHASVGMRELREQLKKEPEVGSPLCSPMLNTIVRGARLKKLYMRSAPTGVGKCIVGKTLIPTDKGLIRIDEIPKYYNVNERHECKANIISYDIETGEKKILPTSHWYNMGKSETIKIRTAQGYEIEGTPEHPIVVGDKNGNIYFKKLKDITEDDMIAISLNNHLFGNNEMSLDLAYLLGILIGDGYINVESDNKKTRSRMTYTKADKFMAEKINQIIRNELHGVNKITTKEHNNSIEYGFGSKETVKFLQQECGLSMNISKHKYIPHSIMTGTKEVVKSFLQGLFDTDGSITRGYFEYCTASQRLAEEVHLMLLNFGIVANKRIKKVNGRQCYVITIYNYPMLLKFKNEIGFRFAREKQERLEQATRKESYNSNNDFVYGFERLQLLHQHLKENYDYGYYNKYKFNNIAFFESVRRSGRTTRERIKKIFEALPNTNLSELEYLRNISNNMYFETIKSIEKSEAIVYDFTVPETHCFVANGTISHNTRLSLADACNIAMPVIYDIDKKKWVKNGVAEPVLFITTELEMDEIQTMIWSFVSGVDEDKILNNETTPEEDERIDKAIEIIEKSPLYLEHMADFDIESVERTVRTYIRQKQIKYVFFDYVHTSLELLEQIGKSSKGIRLREDNVLLMFVTKLKKLCNKYGVFLFTATQVNGDWKHTKDADQNLLRGAKAMADKIDVGIIALEPTRADLEALEPTLMAMRYCGKRPNLVYHIYKNRRGKLVKVKLWLYVDLGTLRIYDVCLTDKDYNLIPIEPTLIETYDENEEGIEENINEKVYDF